MAYRQIAKIFDMEQIREDIELVIKNSERSSNIPSPVGQIAETLGRAPGTIYNYLDGRIKLDGIILDFLHATCIATNGHPDVRKYLEPEGWGLTPSAESAPTKNIEKEFGDAYIALADLHQKTRKAVEDGKVTKNEYAGIFSSCDNLKKQIDEFMGLLREEMNSNPYTLVPKIKTNNTKETHGRNLKRASGD